MNLRSWGTKGEWERPLGSFPRFFRANKKGAAHVHMVFKASQSPAAYGYMAAPKFTTDVFFSLPYQLFIILFPKTDRRINPSFCTRTDAKAKAMSNVGKDGNSCFYTACPHFLDTIFHYTGWCNRVTVADNRKRGGSLREKSE